eukprot:symbB.v1.2.030574.t1/scaffold3463.1/size92345/4
MWRVVCHQRGPLSLSTTKHWFEFFWEPTELSEKTLKFRSVGGANGANTWAKSNGHHEVPSCLQILAREKGEASESDLKATKVEVGAGKQSVVKPAHGEASASEHGNVESLPESKSVQKPEHGVASAVPSESAVWALGFGHHQFISQPCHRHCFCTLLVSHPMKTSLAAAPVMKSAKNSKKAQVKSRAAAPVMKSAKKSNKAQVKSRAAAPVMKSAKKAQVAPKKAMAAMKSQGATKSMKVMKAMKAMKKKAPPPPPSPDSDLDETLEYRRESRLGRINSEYDDLKAFNRSYGSPPPCPRSEFAEPSSQGNVLLQGGQRTSCMKRERTITVTEPTSEQTEHGHAGLPEPSLQASFVAVKRSKEEPVEKVPTVDENEAPPVAKLDSEMISGCVVKGFTAKDFTKTLAGSKRIEEFMTGLPNLYKAKGVSILDDKGFFSYKSKHGQNTILWTEVCLRMAMYFDIAITGKPKDFGRHVHWHLSTVVPGNNLDIATKQLQDLVRQMEDTTPAVLPVG